MWFEDYELDIIKTTVEEDISDLEKEMSDKDLQGSVKEICDKLLVRQKSLLFKIDSEIKRREYERRKVGQ